MRILHLLFVGLSVITAAALSGCVIGKSPPTTFYTLSATEAPTARKLTSGSADALLIGIGPVDMPGYLDRSQIVSRETPNRLGLDEFHQWAEPLNTSLVRVLAENIAQQLPNKRVIQYPWGVTPADVQVVVLVTRFDASAAKQVRLNALWGVFGEGRQELLVTKKSRITQSFAGEDKEAIVAAMSRAAGELSREIATELATLKVQDRLR